MQMLINIANDNKVIENLKQLLFLGAVTPEMVTTETLSRRNPVTRCWQLPINKVCQKAWPAARACPGACRDSQNHINHTNPNNTNGICIKL